MAGHTKGPWKLKHIKLIGAEGYVVEGGTAEDLDRPAIIASCQADDLNMEEVQANARLIAAAPDLLQAAQAALETLERQHDGGDNDACKLLRQAIKEATKNHIESSPES